MANTRAIRTAEKETERSVSATLGSLIPAGEMRDAIHVAVYPVVAGHVLHPGQHVGFLNRATATVGVCTEPLGIVDPFLRNAVLEGQRFWLVLYPRQITSLRHVWTHPGFPEEGAVATAGDAEARLRAFAASLSVSYEDLMAHAQDYAIYGNYWSEGGRFEGVGLPVTFWADYRAVTGSQITPDEQGNFFSCSC